MELSFTKMQGCGNDYIYINCFNKQNSEIINNNISYLNELAKKLSDRHFGIGSDGIVLILPSDSSDALMRMFNSDGSEGKICGNALRCTAKFLYDNKIINKSKMQVDTPSGTREIELFIKENTVISVKANMGMPCFEADKIPAILNSKEIINRKILLDGKNYTITCVSMGNPHAVIFYNNACQLENLEIEKIGPLFEHADIFPDGINTEFVHITNQNNLSMRVWERGSGETLGCGTGACAAAAAAVLNGYFAEGEDINVNLPGGKLIINYSKNGIYMTGGCQTVFSGTILID